MQRNFIRAPATLSTTMPQFSAPTMPPLQYYPEPLPPPSPQNYTSQQTFQRMSVYQDTSAFFHAHPLQPVCTPTPPVVFPTPVYRAEPVIPVIPVLSRTCPNPPSETKVQKVSLTDWINWILKCANGAIQISYYVTGAYAGLASGTSVGLGTGIVFVILCGGRLSLYCLEEGNTLAGYLITNIKHEPTTTSRSDQIRHGVSGLLNYTVKEILHEIALVNVTVGAFLNKANWVANSVTAPILTVCTVAGFAQFIEELILKFVQVKKPSFHIPASVELINRIVAAIIPIIALSSLAAADWFANTQRSRAVGGILSGLAAGRALTLVFELAMFFLEEYQKRQKTNQPDDCPV